MSNNYYSNPNHFKHSNQNPQFSGWAAVQRHAGNQNPHHVSISSVDEILNKKRLSLIRKSMLTSNESNLNALARILVGSDFYKYEFVQHSLRKILCNPGGIGTIALCDVTKPGVSYSDVIAYLNRLREANLLLSVQQHNGYVHVIVNEMARSFLNDTMFSRAAIQAVKNHNPQQYFFDCELCDQIMKVRLHLDIMYLMNGSLCFAHVFANPNLMQNVNALGKLVAMADRLRSNFTVIVSPSVDVNAVKAYVDAHKAPQTRSIRVVQLHQLYLL